MVWVDLASVRDSLLLKATFRRKPGQVVSQLTNKTFPPPPITRMWLSCASVAPPPGALDRSFPAWLRLVDVNKPASPFRTFCASGVRAER